MTFELTNDTRARKRSLGANVHQLKERLNIQRDLLDKLERYNSVFSVPGKHEIMILPPGRRHRFSPREAVLAIFITVNLGERIKSVSPLAREAVENDFDSYQIGRRIHYYGQTVNLDST